MADPAHIAGVRHTPEPFATTARSREAERLAMLIFLATETLLFGGLFAAAFELRLGHGDDYTAASREMHYWLGGLNTALLLTSSALVALAVEAVREGAPRAAKWLLAGAVALGTAFLAVKAVEYTLEFRDGLLPGTVRFSLHGARAGFMNIYLIATGLHAVHVSVGLALLAALIWPLGKARRDPSATVIGNVALYWHLVDLVWVFLYPTLYLAR